MLEKIAAFSMIVVCLIAGYVLIDNHFLHPKLGSPPGVSLDGKRLDVEGLDWREGKTSLILAISSHCRYCIADAPFYKQITNEDQLSKVKVVVISADEAAPLQQFLQANSIRTDKVLLRPLTLIGVSSTPTLLVVDSGGVVRGTFIGALDAGGQAAVRDRLRKTGLGT